VAILGATGRPVLDCEPYQGSLAGFLAEEAALLGHPEVIFSLHDLAARDWIRVRK
jgi:hypothetical protein